jgi:hypothetical protein
MRDEDKPFVCYKQGRWNMKLVPRGGEGWRLLGLWSLPLLILTCGHIALAASMPENETLIGWATLGFVLLIALWAFAMIRWMLAHAEVINLDDLLKLKRELDRDKANRRR